MARWKFYKHHGGFSHVVFTDEGRFICSNVTIGRGILMAAAPRMLDALKEISKPETTADEKKRIAESLIEELRAEYQFVKSESST